jgi:hypothetical protein
MGVHIPVTQMLPAVQVPHWSALPHPSDAEPHSAFMHGSIGVHGLVPQAFGPPPPHV